MKTPRLPWRMLTLLGIALLVPLGVRWLLGQWPGARYVELLAYDWRMRALPAAGADPRIVVVGMDDATLNALPLGERRFYPLPRAMHARLVDELRAGGARVVGFDITFTRDGGAADKSFALALPHRNRPQSTPHTLCTPTPLSA